MSVINVENVGMVYKLSADRITSFKGYFVAALKKEIKKSEHRVFKNLNFEVDKGDVVGIIGRNGAGKSTLLKIIAGVINPTEGNVSVTGNIVPMLELGSGFDFDLTGRENVFLNGSILGYSEKFLNEKYDEIVEFSELGEFIEQPIRNYSSGMIARLAFAIATVVEPEILIVDEILAVGDEAFQRKSKRKMLSLMGGGCTVLFVSHSVAQIREMCTKVLWLEDGKMRMFGDTKKVCDAYQEFLNPKKMVDDEDPNAQVVDVIRKKCRDVMYVFGKRDINYFYRVGVGKEELFAVNIQAGEIYHKYLDKEIIHKNNVFIFAECPKSKMLIQAIEELSSLGKTILFDITCKADDSLDLLNAVYDKVDGIIVSNEDLAKKYIDKKVFINPYIASDRIMQLADWAVYDKEVLPFLSEGELTSEDMIINFNRAKAELQEKNRFKRNLIFINDTLSSEEIDAVLKSLITLLESNSECRLVTLDDWKNQFVSADQLAVKFIKKPSHEDLPRIISMADELVIPDKSIYNMYDEVLKIIARLVKTHISVLGTDGKVLGTNDIEIEFEDEHKRHPVRMGRYFREFISELHKNKCGIVVDEISEQSLSKVRYIVSKLPDNINPVILCRDGYDGEYLELGTFCIPVYGVSENYIGMLFSYLIACSYEMYDFVKKYDNAMHKMCVVEGYEPDNYDDGDIRKFMANKVYYENTEIKLVTLSSKKNADILSEYTDSGMKQVKELTIKEFVKK